MQLWVHSSTSIWECNPNINAKVEHKKVSSKHPQGFILIGFLNTPVDAKELADFSKKQQYEQTTVFELSVPPEACIGRLQKQAFRSIATGAIIPIRELRGKSVLPSGVVPVYSSNINICFLLDNTTIWAWVLLILLD